MILVLEAPAVVRVKLAGNWSNDRAFGAGAAMHDRMQPGAVVCGPRVAGSDQIALVIG